MPPKKDKPGGGDGGGGNGGGGGKGGKKDTTAPSLIGSSTLAIAENQTAGTGFDFETDDDTAIWSLVGSDDDALFSINPDTGVLAFNSPPDFESPTDADGNNVYVVTLQVADEAGNTTTQQVSVTVTNDLRDSAVPAYSGPSAFSVDENTDAVASLGATQPVRWSLADTQDGALFAIDPDTGALSFIAPPDYEMPIGQSADNTYSVTVELEYDGHLVQQLITVTVDDVDDTVAPTPFSNLVIFGDSLSDNGNFSDLAGAFLLEEYGVPFQYVGDGTVRPYDTEAFTDGTAYADTMAVLLDLDASYDNYAIGGAQALGSNLGGAYIAEYTALTYTTFGGGTGTFSIVENETQALAEFGDFDINLAAQVDRYIDDNPTGAPEGTLAVLNIGANDLGEFDTGFFNIILGGVNDFAEDVGNEIELQARRLADFNVAGIALYALPVAEFFVGYGDLNWLERPVARDLIDSVNEEITNAAIRLNADGIETEVVRLDVMSVDILSDMQTYGFLYSGPYLYGFSGDPTWIETSPGVIEPVFDVNPVATAYRPEQILFFDEIHPSGALHDMLAVFSAESLSTDETFGTAGADIYNLSAADDFVVAASGNDLVTLGGGMMLCLAVLVMTPCWGRMDPTC
ncbi:SGNH/GDSL hydrolase family protein [Sulfitobacter aestuariivivens]|uniref:SGNH/GDSL hydrolase family protein n=1 Tax=Sulfitobacter aestuariivivens TaxID=2766981 RepID=UPI00361A9E4B